MPQDQERKRDRAKGGEDAWSKMSVGDWLTRTGQAKSFGGDPRTGAAAGRAVFDPYEEVATGAGAGAAAGRQMVGPGAGAGAMAGRTLAGLDAQRAVDDANALAGWYEAMAYPGPAGLGGGTYDGYVQAYDIDPMLANDPRIELRGIGPLASPYGRQMVRGMAPSPDYINAQRVLGVNRVMGY